MSDRPRPLRAALVLLAAGDSRRVGHQTNKVLLTLAGRRVFTWSLRWAHLLPEITRTVLVIREGDRQEMTDVLAREAPGVAVTMVTGGDSRHASEWAALQVLSSDIEAGRLDTVVIHDAARPLAGTDLFASVIRAARAEGGAIPVREQPDLTAIDGAADPAERLVAVQTPQAFEAAPLLAAYRRADEESFVGTDTASCIEKYADVPVACVAGTAGNIKITFPEDLFLAERLLASQDFDLSGGRQRPHRLRPHLPRLRHREESS